MLCRKFALSLFVLALLVVNCAGPTRNISYQIRSGTQDKLKSIKTIYFGQITCQDTIFSKAIKNVIIQELLSTDIRVLQDSLADAKIELTATMISDMAMGGASSATRTLGVSSFSGSAGGYISGITAQIIKSGEILASITADQTRNSSGNPDPPEEITLELADKLICVLRYDYNHCGYMGELK